MIKISGFTFIKNGLTLGYPILDSIKSIEPLCDEVIINVGFDDPNLIEDDGTERFLKQNLKDPKYKFLKSWWDPELSKGGLILSQQTNIALDNCSGDACLYIQGDEAIHEEDYDVIKKSITEMVERDDLNGLVFNYIHLFGNVNIQKFTRTIYRREVRIIKNNIGLESYKDAQGFRFENGEKPIAKLISAKIMHYGWARKETVMKEKKIAFEKLYHGKEHNASEDWEYNKVFGLIPYKGTHPKVMHSWIEKNQNDLTLATLKSNFKFKHIRMAISDFIEKYTGIRLGEFKNYRIIK